MTLPEEDKPLSLSQRAYLGAAAVEVLEQELEFHKTEGEAAVSLLAKVLKLHGNLSISKEIKSFIKAYRGL